MKITNHKCQGCGKPFPAGMSKKRKYCSKFCSMKTRRILKQGKPVPVNFPLPKTSSKCPVCGITFYRIATDNRIMYCSKKCIRKSAPIIKGTKNQRRRNYLLRLKVIKYLGGKCVGCGETDWRVLQTNHINGGGRKESYKKGCVGIWKEIVNGEREGDFDLRCANCNVRYEYEKGRRNDPSRSR